MEQMKVACAQYLTLGQLKANLRIEEDDEDDLRDMNLMQCAAAAEELVLNHCHTTWDELRADYAGMMPPSLHRAMLAIACGMYQEPTGYSGRAQNTVPMHVQALLTPFVKLSKK